MPLNVLITAGSRRVPLIQAFRRALVEAGCRGRVITTDVNPLSPAVHVADRAFHVPLARECDYVEALEEICSREGVGLLVPTLDDELAAVGAATDMFRRAGVVVAASPKRTADVCNDKMLTGAHLSMHGVSAAATWLPSQVPQDAPLPLFVKPRHGRGSVGAFPARTRTELEFFTGYVADAVVQEFLSGPEYTIDMLCDRDGRPISIVPRERTVIRAGVTDRGRTVRDPRLIDLAERCATALDFFGAVNVQCRVVGGVPSVFEINPHFSDGIALTIAAGADFPRMLVEIALGRRVPPCVGGFTDDVWMTSYESSLFLGPDHDAALATRPVPMLEVA